MLDLLAIACISLVAILDEAFATPNLPQAYAIASGLTVLFLVGLGVITYLGYSLMREMT